MSQIIRLHPRPRSVGRGVIRAGLDRLPGAALTVTGGGSAYPNEPSGMTALFADPMQALTAYPGNSGGPGLWHWDKSTGDVAPTAGTDDSPLTEHYCWDYLYPAGMTGGQSPCRSLSQVSITPQTQRTLYQCFVFKYPSNWTNNGNSGTKFSFFRNGAGTNHTWKAREGDNGGSGLELSLTTQGAGATIDYFGRPGVDVIPNDAWAKVELLVVNNSPAGTANGTLRMWYSIWGGSAWPTPTEALFRKGYSGSYTTRIGEVLFAASGQSTSWQSIVHDPTYGGGLNPVPHDMTLKIAHWYASSK